MARLSLMEACESRLANGDAIVRVTLRVDLLIAPRVKPVKFVSTLHGVI